MSDELKPEEAVDAAENSVNTAETKAEETVNAAETKAEETVSTAETKAEETVSTAEAKAEETVDTAEMKTEESVNAAKQETEPAGRTAAGTAGMEQTARAAGSAPDPAPAQENAGAADHKFDSQSAGGEVNPEASGEEKSAGESLKKAGDAVKKAGSGVKNFFAGLKDKMPGSGREDASQAGGAGAAAGPAVNTAPVSSTAQALDRDSQVVRASLIGILANVALSIFKAIVGVLSNSIAITLDAVNNLSDALSSIITIVGTKLAGKRPDKKHPFGYGRIEYLTTTIISVIILYAGISSLTESVKKIFRPVKPQYGFAAMLVLAIAIVVKIYLGQYVKGIGEKVNSDSLQASGTDALLDAVISASVFVTAIIYMASGLSLEAWVGLVISILIIKSGLDMLKDSLGDILGKRVDAQLASDVKATVSSFPNVAGAYDLVLHNYGPDLYTGSVHIEVPDTMTAESIDTLTRQIANKVYCEYNIIMTGIGIYSINTKDERAIGMREEIRKIAMAHPFIKQVHGFYLNEAEKHIQFDLVVSFNAKDRKQVFDEVLGAVKAKYPEYTVTATMDTDFSD